MWMFQKFGHEMGSRSCFAASSNTKIFVPTSPLLADELLFSDGDLWPAPGVLWGDSVVPFTDPLEVPLVVMALTGAAGELEFPLLLLTTVFVPPLASLNFSAN